MYFVHTQTFVSACSNHVHHLVPFHDTFKTHRTSINLDKQLSLHLPSNNKIKKVIPPRDNTHAHTYQLPGNSASETRLEARQTVRESITTTITGGAICYLT